MAKTNSPPSTPPILQGTDYNALLQQISTVYEQGRQRAAAAVNTNMLETYWQIGHDIVEFEQGGKVKAPYGAHLLEHLSKDLNLLHGKGFSLSNLKRMRQFYARYPISATVSHQLTWSHYIELLKIEDDLERSFYEKQCLVESWDVRSLHAASLASSAVTNGTTKPRHVTISNRPKASGCSWCRQPRSTWSSGGFWGRCGRFCRGWNDRLGCPATERRGHPPPRFFTNKVLT